MVNFILKLWTLVGRINRLNPFDISGDSLGKSGSEGIVNPIGIEVKANRLGLGSEADKLKAIKETHMEEGEIAEKEESKAEEENDDAKEEDDAKAEDDGAKEEEETPTVRKKQKVETPLMEASFGGHIDIVNLLIAHGEDVNGQSSFGMYRLPGGHLRSFRGH